MMTCQNHAVGKGQSGDRVQAAMSDTAPPPQVSLCQISISNECLIHLGSAGAALNLTIEVESNRRSAPFPTA